MHELRILTHTGKTIAFVSPTMKILRAQLQESKDLYGFLGYSFRDRTGWCESGGEKVDNFSAIPATVLWSLP